MFVAVGLSVAVWFERSGLVLQGNSKLLPQLQHGFVADQREPVEPGWWFEVWSSSSVQCPSLFGNDCKDLLPVYIPIPT